MKKIGLAAGVAALAALLLLFAASLYLDSAAFRHLLVDRVNESIAGRIQIEDHDLFLPAGQLVLSGVELWGTDGQMIAAVGKLRLRIFLPALAWRSVDIVSLIIDQAYLDLIADAQDRTNLADALAVSARQEEKPPPDTGNAWQVNVRDIRLRDGQIAFRHPSKELDGTVTGLAVSGRGNLRQRIGKLKISASELNVQASGVNESLRAILVEAEYNQFAVHPIAVTLRVAESSIRMGGAVSLIGDQMHLALSSDLDVRLDQVQPWLPGAADLAGRLKGKIDLKGALVDPSVAVQLRIEDGRFEAIPVPQALLEARMDKRQVQIDGLEIRSAVGELDVSGTIDLRPLFPHSFEEPSAALDAPGYRLVIDGRRLTPHRVPGITFPWGGTWQGQVHVEGSGISAERANGTGHMDLHIEEVQVTKEGRPTRAEIAVRARWAAQEVHLEQAQAVLEEHQLNGSGRFHWVSGRFEAEATARSPQLADLGAVLGIALPGGNGTLKLHGRGSVAEPVVGAVLLAQDLSLAPWTFGQLLVQADLGPDGTVRFPRLVLQNKGSFMEGKGSLNLLRPGGAFHDDPDLQLSFALDPLVLSDFTADPPGNVRLNGHLQVGGSLNRLTADLKLASSPVRWANLSGQAQGQVRWDNGRLIVPDLKLTNGESVVKLQGSSRWREAKSGHWTSDPYVQADLQSAGFLLQDWLPELKGALDIQAALEGRISDLKGSFRVNGSDLESGVQTFSSMRLEGRLSDDTMHADRLVVYVAPDQPIEGSGWYAFDQRFQARLSGTDIHLRHIDALQQSVSFQGRLNFSVEAQGTLARPVLAGRLHVHQPRIGDQQWDDFSVRLDLRDRQLAVDADLNFNLTARYRIDNGDFDVSAVFDDTHLTPYLALLVGNPWAGRLSGKVQASGNRYAPEKMGAHIVLTQGSLTHRQVDLLHLDHLEARLANGVLTLPSTRFKLMQEGELLVQAGGPIQRDLIFKTEGTLPLAALAPFAAGMADASGHIRIAAQGQGPWTKMQVRGELALARIGFLWENSNQVIHDVNGMVRISPQRVVVDNVSGMLDSGRFRLNGQLQLADWRPAEGSLTLNAQALPLNMPDTMDLSVGADLVLKGNPRQSLLEGQVTLLEGAYYKNVNFNLLSSLTQSRRPIPPPRTWSPPSWLGAIALNVTVGYRHPLLVDNNIARMQIAPDFKIGGTAANPVISGRAGVTEGELFVRKTTFSIQRGVVDFVNPYRIEPVLDIAAQTQIRKWKVTLTVTGPPDKLAVKLSSDPPESDSNLLSLILVGRTSSELTTGGAGGTTEQMLATLVESAWGEEIRARAGVDMLEVETGAQDETQDPDRIQVTVGKQVSRRLTVKYSVEAAGGETIQRATSEYRLLEHILASGFQDTSGTYGGELLFRIEFR